MIGDKLVVTLVVTDTGSEWKAEGVVEVLTPSRKIEQSAFLAATWWAIEALTPSEEVTRTHGQSHRTTEPKASTRG